MMMIMMIMMKIQRRRIRIMMTNDRGIYVLNLDNKSHYSFIPVSFRQGVLNGLME